MSMVEQNKQKLSVEDWDPACVLVVGDVMLDTWIYGTSKRISSEAPVPIVNYRSQSHILGGAANVARNIAHLGVKQFWLEWLVQTVKQTPITNSWIEKRISLMWA